MSMVLPSHCYERYFLVWPGIAGLDVSVGYMQFHNSENISVLERVIASFLVAFVMFTVSYTAMRVDLSQLGQVDIEVGSNVIPHPASLWSDLGTK